VPSPSGRIFLRSRAASPNRPPALSVVIDGSDVSNRGDARVREPHACTERGRRDPLALSRPRSTAFP
jgi:hypothetical protein